MSDAAQMTTPAGDIKKPSTPKSSGQLFLATVATLAYFGVLCLAMFKPIPQENHDIVITMLSVAGSILMGTWAYYFGSSIGSRAKEEALSAAIKNQPGNGPHEEKTTATAQVNVTTSPGA